MEEEAGSGVRNWIRCPVVLQKSQMSFRYLLLYSNLFRRTYNLASLAYSVCSGFWSMSCPTGCEYTWISRPTYREGSTRGRNHPRGRVEVNRSLRSRLWNQGWMYSRSKLTNHQNYINTCVGILAVAETWSLRWSFRYRGVQIVVVSKISYFFEYGSLFIKKHRHTLLKWHQNLLSKKSLLYEQEHSKCNPHGDQ